LFTIFLCKDIEDGVVKMHVNATEYGS